jgi:ribosomal protein L37E
MPLRRHLIFTVMTKFEEIAKAWLAALNPTPSQQEIADYRIEICNGCEFKAHNQTLDFYYCNACGCPLSKKIFSPMPPDKACPKQKWDK